MDVSGATAAAKGDDEEKVEEEHTRVYYSTHGASGMLGSAAMHFRERDPVLTCTYLILCIAWMRGWVDWCGCLREGDPRAWIISSIRVSHTHKRAYIHRRAPPPVAAEVGAVLRGERRGGCWVYCSYVDRDQPPAHTSQDSHMYACMCNTQTSTAGTASRGLWPLASGTPTRLPLLPLLLLGRRRRRGRRKRCVCLKSKGCGRSVLPHARKTPLNRS